MQVLAAALVLAAVRRGPVTGSPDGKKTDAGGWLHGWDTPAAAWWGYGAMQGGGFTDAEVAVAAKTYSVVCLSLCNGAGSTAADIINVSARLKAVNPSIKVIQYWNVNQWACYPKTDPDFAVFLAHPEWWLRDDNGNPVRAASGSPQYDFTNAAGVAHWLEMPITKPGGSTGHIDGYLLDGGAIYNRPANVSADRAELLKQGMWSAIGSMQRRLTAANGGLVLANGMIGGPIDPHTPNDPYNLGVLAHAGGIENERGTPTFELVNSTSGAFHKDGVAANLAAIERASRLANGTKVVAVNYWAGPIVGFQPRSGGDNSGGFPVFAKGDAINRTPNGTHAEVVEGWKAMQARWQPFNLAMFLSVAGPGTYFTQMVWYAAFEGFLPCPDSPGSCLSPQPFFPLMQRPLGAPAGPRVQLGPYKWRRNFAHATVTVDLDEPLGPGTNIDWG